MKILALLLPMLIIAQASALIQAPTITQAPAVVQTPATTQPPIIVNASASIFDMQGTINDVISPTSLKVDNTIVNLDGVDASGLNRSQYYCLMLDLRDWLIGKNVFVKDNYVYFDLVGSYNSVSINEMIQKEIKDMRRYFWDFCYFKYTDYLKFMGVVN
jgi:hypothetical protein